MTPLKGMKYIAGIIIVLLCSNNNVYADVSVNNLTDLKSKTESGESVIIESNINTEGTISPVGTIIINGNHYNIDGGTSYQILNNTVDLTISDANFLRGQAYQGGILYNQNKLNIIRGSYSDSSAWDGGALFLLNTSTTNIDNSVFNSNIGGGNGAAIYNQGSLTVNSTDFTSNQASSSGGAIYNTSVLGILGGTYSLNSAWNAGAIYLTGTSTANIENSNFDTNTSNGHGGAIYNQGSLTVTNSDFSSNHANASGGTIYNEAILDISGGNYSGNSAWDGGAIYNTASAETEIQDAVYKSNQASGYGGAIYNLGKLTVADTDFGGVLPADKNTAKQGSGIYNDGNLILNGGSFNKNEAERGGGLYLASASTTDITNTNFVSNVATHNSNPSYAAGGAIYNEAILDISGGNYSGNSAWDGGAIYNAASAKTEIQDSVFSSNQASGYGGAIYSSGELTLNTLSNGVTFTENSSINGGAIYNSNKLTINGSIFGQRIGLGTSEDPYIYSKGNTVTTSGGWQGGGAIFNSTGVIDISGNTNFFDNKALISDTALVPSGGGAIYNNSGTLRAIASGSDRIVFQSNSSTSGGAIFTSGNTIITNAIFGAVRGSGTDADPYVYSGGNIANATGNYQGGGAIYNSASNVSINGNTNFYGNIANIDNAPNLNGGGAIYTNSGTINITADESGITFGGNKATRGGALYNNFGEINLRATSGDINFRNNEATVDGGAIYNYASATNLYAQGGDIIFRNNVATNLGGAIYNDQGSINLMAQLGNKIVFDDSIYNNTGSSVININKNDGSDYLGTVEFNNSVNGIYDPVINVYNGVLKLGHTYQSDGTTLRSTGTIANNILNLYGGTIDMMDGIVGNYISTQSLSIAKDSSIGLKFDVDLSNSTTDYFSLTNSLVNSGSGTQNGVFRIDDINVLHDATATNTNVNLFTGSNTPSLSQIVGATIDTTLYRYIVSQDSSNLGQLNFLRQFYSDELYNALKSSDIVRSLSMSSDILVVENLNNMIGTNGELTVNGNGYTIDGQDHTGVIIGTGQTYNINDVLSYSKFSSSDGGAINNAGTLNITNTLITNNTATGDGGAIYNTGTMTIKGLSAITNNSSSGKGGAIYNEGTVNIIADTGDITISGNSDSNGVGVYLKGGEMDFNAASTRKITISDKIESEDNTSIIKINSGTENNDGSIVLDADMSGYKGAVNLDGGVLKLGTSGIFFGNAIDKIALGIAESATLNLQNNKIDTIYASSYTGGGRFLMDVSLSDAKSDSVIVDTINQTSLVTISGIQLLSDNASNQSIKMFSDGVNIDDFSISANTSTKRYLITKDADNSGFIYVKYLGDVGDGLIAQLESTGTRSYSQTSAQYTATLNLPNMNAISGQTNTLEIFGQNKIFSGNNTFSLFKVDTEDPSSSAGTARELIVHDAAITNARGINGSAFILNGKDAQATLDNVNVSNNQSTSNGGSISITNGASLVINGGIFSNNTANGKGGAIYIKGGASDPSTLTIISNINNTVFSDNNADTTDNSIYMAGNSVLNINNSSLAKLILSDGIETSGANNILNINKAIGSAPIDGSFDITSDFSTFKGNNYVNLYNGALKLTSSGKFFGNTGNQEDYINLSMKNDSILNLQNNKIDTIYLNSFETEGTNTLAKLDIDLSLHKVDKIISSTVTGTPVLNIDTFNIITNAVTDSTFDITSPNILINYIGDNSYYTSDYSYQVAKESNSIHFISEYIGGDGLKRVLNNIGVRTYSMVLDSEGKTETYTANENLPSLNAEYSEGRENRVTIYGNGGTISGASQYSLFKVDSSLNNTERELRLNDVTLANAKATQGSALYEKGQATVSANSVKFQNNISNSEGGAVYLADGAKLNISGSSLFKNNISSSKGGAIYMKGFDSDNKPVMTVTSSSSTVEFTGNKQNDTENNAIYMAGNATLNLKSTSVDKPIIFNDSIASEGINNTININIPDESSYNGKVVFNSDMSGYTNDINVYSGNLNLTYPNMRFNTSSFKMYQNATLDLRNALIDNVNISNLQFDSGTSNLSVDIDGLHQKADTINALGSTGTLNINNFNVLTDSLSSKTGPILISETEGLNISTNPDATYLGPIYKYFLTSSGTQSVVLNRAYSNSFNPVVYSSPVTSTVGTYSNMMNTYNQAFTNSDVFMMQPQAQRLAYRLRNRYAIQEVDNAEKKTIYPELVSGPWYRPYTTFESVGLKNGPTVSNTSYGSFVGYDMPLEEGRHGFQNVISAYAGYNGSNQSYEGVNVYQNGGLFGINKSFFKNNFFTSLTANISASSAHSSSSRSTSDFTTLATGIASKTGYNIELGESKCIVQPSLMLAYSFIKTFNYRDSNGINYSSDALNVLQINPGVKFIANIKGSYQPYMGVNMVWNMMNDGEYKANDISIPMVSVKPYVEYGVGLQKRFGERFTGYLQSMVRNGGRNGVSLQFGFKWAI